MYPSDFFDVNFWQHASLHSLGWQCTEEHWCQFFKAILMAFYRVVFIVEEYIFEKYDILKTGLILRLFILWIMQFLFVMVLEDQSQHRLSSSVFSLNLDFRNLVRGSSAFGGVFDGFPRNTYSSRDLQNVGNI